MCALEAYRSKESHTGGVDVLSSRMFSRKFSTRSPQLVKRDIFSLNPSPLLFPATGLYYKTFYGSNCCRIIISQSVCNFLSLPPRPNICGQDQEPTISADSSMGLYSGMIEPCLEILDQGGSDRKWQTLQLIMIQQQ